VRTALALLVLLAAGAALSLAIGPITWAQVDHQVLTLRGTRLAAGALAGAALAVAGTLMQGLFRNPLAEPAVVGVTAGAALGAQVAVLLAAVAPAAVVVLPTELWRPLAAFVGALGALAALLMLSRRKADLAALLLIGMVLSVLISSLAAYLVAIANDRYELGRALVSFALGALDAASPAAVALAVPLVAISVAAAWFWSGPLDVALSGAAEAASLGVDLRRLRRWLLVWTALLCAAAVAVGGGVGFVGLIVPNALRATLGPAHRALIPASALGGAAFLTLADVCARACHPGPGEIPLGAITGLVGAPFFLWFFRRERLAGRL
jgi:iron complex transport system permease protein